MATVEKLEKNRAKLTITIDAEQFGQGLQKAYLKAGKQYNVPGFRKGKAPKKVIETMYGDSVFFEDAFELLWGDAYDAALTEHDLFAVEKPSIDIEKISREDGIVFTAEVQLKPEVKLGKYKGIEVPAPTYTVEDKDVDAAIEAEREKNARFIDVERAVADGDRVVLDYSGSVDGEKFEGGTAEEQVLVIGSKTFIPGFEEQMIGMQAGEEKDITVTFPAEYHAEELAGKEAVFHVAVKQVQIKEMPALDDEFAKDISSFDTLKELRADKKRELTERAEKNGKVAVENAALKAACENAEIDIPECMVDQQINYMMQDFAYRLAGSGIKFEDYIKYSGVTPEQFKAGYHDEALERVRLQLVIEAVGKAEKAACSDEDLEKSMAEYAEANKLPLEDLKKGLTEDDKNYFRDRVIAQKAVEAITGSIVLTAPEKAAKPKKAAAKKADDKAEAKPVKAKKADGEAAEAKAKKPAKKAEKKEEPKA